MLVRDKLILYHMDVQLNHYLHNAFSFCFSSRNEKDRIGCKALILLTANTFPCLLNCFIHFGVTGRVCNGQRQGPPLDETPVHP